ncbi:MAG: hypothetical protein RPU39_13720 [Candidatus Sedimenticola sp. (ex Thyasira tokunagai)]
MKSPGELGQLLHYVPFIGLAVGEKPIQNPVVVRLLEAAIIGGIIMYANGKVMEERLLRFDRQMSEQSAMLSRNSESINHLTVEVAKVNVVLRQPGSQVAR